MIQICKTGANNFLVPLLFSFRCQPFTHWVKIEVQMENSPIISRSNRIHDTYPMESYKALLEIMFTNFYVIFFANEILNT